MKGGRKRGWRTQCIIDGQTKKEMKRETRLYRKKGAKREGDQGPIVRKLFNANPGLKVNRSINFSSIKMFFTAYVLCRLRLLKLKTEGQTI